MKRNFILAAVLVATLTGCNQRDPASQGMVRQCGLDAQTNSNKCVWVYPQQVQQGQVMQQGMQQGIPMQPGYMPSQQPVIINNGHSGVGDAVVAGAAGMMLGHALSSANSGSSARYYGPTPTGNQTVVNKTVIVNNHATPLSSTPAPPIVPPVAPVTSQSLNIPAKPIAPPSYTQRPSAPVTTSFRSSSSNSSSFRRK
jgi:hypothetical protein